MRIQRCSKNCSELSRLLELAHFSACLYLPVVATQDFGQTSWMTVLAWPDDMQSVVVIEYGTDGTDAFSTLLEKVGLSLSESARSRQMLRIECRRAFVENR